MHLFFKNLLEKLHLTYKGKSIFTKFYWGTWLDRRKHGFDITDTWNLDYTFAKFMVPRLLVFTDCLANKDYSTGVPFLILDKIRQEYIKKGYKYDEENSKFNKEKINDEVFNKAHDEWFHIVDTITVGLQDFLLEDDRYNEWYSAWKATLDSLENEVKKCKNNKEKIKVLKQYHISYQDYKDGLVDEHYLSQKLRKKSMKYLSEYFYDLWW